jgi:hypothetical protein
MRQIRPSWSTLLLLLAVCSTALSGQETLGTVDKEASSGLVAGPPLIGSLALQPLVPQQALDPSGTHAHKLAGFAAGVTVGAVVMSLDEVLGSGCIGSGDYLLVCRIGFVGGSLVAGGLGALAGAVVRTDGVRRRSTRILVGSALGAGGAFLVSTVSCHQEDDSNPAFLCGFDGMVETAPILVAAAVGGTLGATIGGRAESPRLIHLAAAPGRGGRFGLRATAAWQPR